jgi:hypothetical protein
MQLRQTDVRDPDLDMPVNLVPMVPEERCEYASGIVRVVREEFD